MSFLTRCFIGRVQYTDSSSAPQLISQQGCGKIRRIAGKVLWIQHTVFEKLVTMVQVPAVFNLADIGMKSLAIGVLDLETHAAYGLEERDQVRDKHVGPKRLAKSVKMLIQFGIATSSLGPNLFQFC